jgi:hypothetical protein
MSAEWIRELSKFDRFEFEQQIMSCWNVVTDLKDSTEAVLEQNLSKDQTANILLGLGTLYQNRFDKLFRMFEQMIREQKESNFAVEMKHKPAYEKEYIVLTGNRKIDRCSVYSVRDSWYEVQCSDGSNMPKTGKWKFAQKIGPAVPIKHQGFIEMLDGFVYKLCHSESPLAHESSHVIYWHPDDL